jgi:hypothetical protein
MSKEPAPDEDNTAVEDEDDSILEFTEETPAKKQRLTDKVDTALIGYLSKTEVKDANYHFCMGIAENMRKMTDAQASYAKIRIQQVRYEVEFPQFHNSNVIPSGATTDNIHLQ